MAFAVVQNSTGVAYNGGTGNSVTNSLPVAAGAGNTVIGTVLIQDNSTGITVVDNNSVSAPQALEVRDSITSGANVAVFVKTNVTGGPTSWTATNTGGNPNANLFMALEEYSGFGGSAAVDGTPVGIPLLTTTGANSMNTGNTTTTVNGDFVWSFVWVVSGGSNSMTIGTVPAYAANLSNPGTNSYIWTEWLTQGTLGAIAGTWQCSNTTSTAVIGVVAISQGAAAAACIKGSLALMGVGCGIALARKIEENPILTRRGLLLPRRRSLIGHNGGPPLDE